MDADSLDLCISCGSHVADGTPYCSMSCQNQDQSVFYPATSAYASSCSQRYFPIASTSSAHRYNGPHRRPLLDLQEPQLDSLSSEDILYTAPSAHKLASIAEWAKGVWGESGEDEEDDVLHMRSRKAVATTSIPTKKSSSSKASPTRPSHRSSGSLCSYTPPRFTLTAQHLAPPAMSIATTTNIDDDLYSIRTPSSRASSPKASSPKKEIVDPWISSPPYEFVYSHYMSAAQQRPSPSTLHLQERGRTLVRV